MMNVMLEFFSAPQISAGRYCVRSEIVVAVFLKVLFF
jgi:hypothetical protein